MSHGIDSLEQWFDVELFERNVRGAILTAAGRQYLPYISEALSMIATGTLRLPNRSFEDRLSISSTGLFACKLLLPQLHKFCEMYPNMLVTVDASRQIVQLPSDQFDVAIRSSREPWPKLSCDLLGRIRFVPVGAPNYVGELSRGGTLDWSRATLIHISTASEDWQTWCGHSQTDISPARKVIVSSARFALEAAADGAGLAIGRLRSSMTTLPPAGLPSRSITLSRSYPPIGSSSRPAPKRDARSLPFAIGCSRKCRRSNGTATLKSDLLRDRRETSYLTVLERCTRHALRDRIRLAGRSKLNCLVVN
jgi:DNA-binding transcriptional LysR family regulator